MARYHREFQRVFYSDYGNINVEEEIAKLTTELEYTKGFLKSVQNKLANEFVNGAPEKVLANERQKKKQMH
jgi:valyl-tRNA synthetase